MSVNIADSENLADLPILSVRVVALAVAFAMQLTVQCAYADYRIQFPLTEAAYTHGQRVQ